MEYQEFKEKLKTELPEVLAERVGDVEISEHSVQKLQEQTYDALTITVEGDNVGLNLNVSGMYKSYENGMNYDEILDHTVDMVLDGFKGRPEVNLSMLQDYQQMRELLSVQLVSKESNAEMLKGIPHQELEDLAMVYRFVLNQDKGGISSILVTNSLMESYGITLDELHADALTFAPENHPATIRSMQEVLNELSGGIMELPPMDNDVMYVASVECSINGAAAITYPGFFDQAAERLEGDFFVLPSSIHEVLLVKDTGEFSLNELRAMVREVNATQVEPEERLSGNVYYYDSKERTFEMGEKFEARQRVAERGSVLKDLKEKKTECAEKPKEAESIVPKKEEGAR